MGLLGKRSEHRLPASAVSFETTTDVYFNKPICVGCKCLTCTRQNIQFKTVNIDINNIWPPELCRKGVK